MCVFQFSLTFCPHKIVTAGHVTVPQNILKMHLPLSMGSLLHVSPSPLPRPLSWILRRREGRGERKGNVGGKGKEGKGGKWAMLAFQTASLDPPLNWYKL